MLHLSESDFRFLVETVATNRRDHGKVMDLVRGKEDLLDPMLEDSKLVARRFHQDESVVRASPHLLFAVFLRRGRRELANEAYVIEVDAKGKRIPVFDAPAVVELLSNNQPVITWPKCLRRSRGPTPVSYTGESGAPGTNGGSVTSTSMT